MKIGEVNVCGMTRYFIYEWSKQGWLICGEWLRKFVNETNEVREDTIHLKSAMIHNVIYSTVLFR